MEKKIKNSVKTEMKNMVQKELAKIMAKQISNEDFFKEMVQDVISDFYEDVDVSKQKENISDSIGKRPLSDYIDEKFDNASAYEKLSNFSSKNTRDKLEHLSDIACGKYKEEFLKHINYGDEPKKSQVSSIRRHIPPLFTPESKVEFTSDQLNSIFNNTAEDRNPLQNLIFNQPNRNNLRELNNITKSQASEDFVEKMQYTKEILEKLFNYIENNMNKLDATHEQVHIGKRSIELYSVVDRENKDDFSFELEIKGKTSFVGREIFLKNVAVDSMLVNEGIISLENAEKLLDLSQKIYSETIIEPLSKTEPDEQIIEVAEENISKKVQNKNKKKEK